MAVTQLRVFTTLTQELQTQISDIPACLVDWIKVAPSIAPGTKEKKNKHFCLPESCLLLVGNTLGCNF